MKYFMLVIMALVGLSVVDNANATGRFRQRQNNNVRVEKVVVRDNVRVERVVVRDNHHHNNQVRVERVVVAKPVYQDVVVERVVVDKHGSQQRVRTVERIRVR